MARRLDVGREQEKDLRFVAGSLDRIPDDHGFTPLLMSCGQS
jgi:hypothetical protein